MRFLIFLFSLLTFPAFAEIQIVAAENIYADIAASIGGQAVSVTSILNNPNQDPHLFSADPKTAEKLQNAKFIIVNGANYDPWAEKLIKNSHAQVINIAKINQIKDGANPHLWYHLDYIEIFAKKLTLLLSQDQPNQKETFQENLKKFLYDTKKIQDQIDRLKATYQNLPITATEPIAGYLVQALGLNMRNQRFQLSIMNGTEPSAKDRAAMIDDLKNHRVVLLIYNQQVTDPTTDYIRNLAQGMNIPVVGVSELLPVDTHYLAWYQSMLNQFGEALAQQEK